MSDVENKLTHANQLIRSAMIGLAHDDKKRLLRAVQEISQVRQRLAAARSVPGVVPVDRDLAAVGNVDGGRD